MKRIKLLLIIFFITSCLTGCGKGNVDELSENMKKMELTGNLITYEAYYHNVVEYKKEAGSGITHVLEKDRKLFIEYTGTIKFGIDLSLVKIDVDGNEINVFIPKAKVIGEPNVDKENFKSENFLESKDGINKNKLTVEDSNNAFEKAQNNIKNVASKDEELISMAQKRAKVLIEENIRSFSNLDEKQYVINWEYGQ